MRAPRVMSFRLSWDRARGKEVGILGYAVFTVNYVRIRSVERMQEHAPDVSTDQFGYYVLSEREVLY